MATKTAKPTRIEINCETGEQTVIELTAEEIAQLEADQAAAAAAQAQAAADAAARQAAKDSANAKLAALGLTAEEIAALNG